MEPVMIVAAGVVLVGVPMWASRQVAKGRRSFVWLTHAPLLLVWPYLGWFLLNLLPSEPIVAIFGLAVVVPTYALYVRMVRRIASTLPTSRSSADPAGPALDYLVWTVLGVPMLLVGLLIVYLVLRAIGIVGS